jgi:hypothetical protein
VHICAVSIERTAPSQGGVIKMRAQFAAGSSSKVFSISIVRSEKALIRAAADGDHVAIAIRGVIKKVVAALRAGDKRACIACCQQLENDPNGFVILIGLTEVKAAGLCHACLRDDDKSLIAKSVSTMGHAPAPWPIDPAKFIHFAVEGTA